jgi:predicted nucleic-acid-binding Zn-ribbon protein
MDDQYFGKIWETQMATSTCLKCGGTGFENKEVSPNNSKFKVTFVQCVKCGGVVGVMDFFNTGAELQEIKRAIAAIAATVSIR